MRKRLIGRLAIVMLALSLCACGDEEPKEKKRDKTKGKEVVAEKVTSDDVVTAAGAQNEDDQWVGTPVSGDNANYAGMEAWDAFLACLEWTNANANYVEVHYVPSAKAMEDGETAEFVAKRTAANDMFYAFERIYRTNDGGRADNFLVRMYDAENLLETHYLSIRDWDSKSYTYSENVNKPGSSANQPGHHHSLVTDYYDYFQDAKSNGVEEQGDTLVIRLSRYKYYVKNGLIEKIEYLEGDEVHTTKYFTNYMVMPDGYTEKLVSQHKRFESKERDKMDEIGDTLGLPAQQ